MNQRTNERAPTATEDRRRFVVGLAAGAAALTFEAVASHAKDTEDDSPKFEDVSWIVEEKLRGTKVPGAAFAAIVDGELRAAGASGRRKRDDDAKVGLDDKFHLGSCTKAMTATLVGKLVERGDLAWTTTVAELFPRLTIHEGYRDVTVRQLLAHVGGTPHDIPRKLWNRLWEDRELDPRESRMLLVRETLAAPPRENPSKYVYSNTGYAVVGAALERIADVPWETLLAREIFEPLGMRSAGFGAPASKGQVDQPWGHNPDPVPPYPFGDNPPAIGPGGTVHASIRDWAKFARLHLTDEPAGIVSAETLAKRHEPLSGSDGYAMGWETTERSWSRGKILVHTGTNTMNYAVAWLAPREKFGVVVACNLGGAGSDALCDALAAAAIERYAR